MSEITTLPATLTATDLFFNPGAFEQLQRAATMFASSSLVPAHMQGRDKIGDCAIALALAHEMRESPIMVMQNIYVVKGKAGWNAQYLIARANKYGIFKGNLKWRFEDKGDIEITKAIKDKGSSKVKARNLSATCYAVLKDTGEEVSETVDLEMAEAEEWTRNSKYHTMARLMLQYRSATFLIRLNCPEVMMGLPVIEEVEDMVDGGELRMGADGFHRVDPAASTRPTRRGKSTAPIVDAKVETVSGADADTSHTGKPENGDTSTEDDDQTSGAASDVVVETLNQEQGDASKQSETGAETGAKSDTEVKKDEPANESPAPIPSIKVFTVPDSRASDWKRFKEEFITGMNSIAPDQMDDMILENSAPLQRFQKEDRIGHASLMEKLKQRREAKVTD